MTKQTLLMPLGQEHSRLAKIATGEKNIEVKFERIKEYLSEDDKLEDVCDDIFKAECKTQSIYAPFVDVHPPEKLNEGFIIRKTLNERGKKLLGFLEDGWICDGKTGDENLQETVAFYEGHMEKGRLENRYVDVISKNTDPRLKGVRSKIVYFRMKNDKQGNAIVGSI